MDADVGVTVTVIRQYITNRFCKYKTMANALGPLIKPKDPKFPRLLQSTSQPVPLLRRRARGQEVEVGELDEVVEVDKVDVKVEINGPLLYIPQMETLEVLRLERQNMRSRPPLVLFVSQRNKPQILTILPLAPGLVLPANWTLSQPFQTSALVSSV